MEPKVYIIMPVHNRKEVTRTFILCLLEQTYKNYHLVLVDDGSTDGTADMVKSYLPESTILTGKGDWWWGGSLEQGYQWVKAHVVTRGDVVLIANDDVEFGPDYLQNGINFLKNAPGTLLLSPAYSRQSGKLIDAGVIADWRYMTFDQAPTKEEINCIKIN